MLTPEEIQSREFLVSLRGYDRDEVHAFLDEVAEAFAQLQAEAGGVTAVEAEDDAPAAVEPAPVQAPEPVAAPVAEPTPERAPSPFATIGIETQRILDAAQSAGEEILARAEAEANRAREEALATAEAEVAKLREQAAATQRQIDVLHLRRDEISDRMRQARETADLALRELEASDDAPEEVSGTATAAASAPEGTALPDDAVADDAVADDAVVGGAVAGSGGGGPAGDGPAGAVVADDDVVVGDAAGDGPVADEPSGPARGRTSKGSGPKGGAENTLDLEE